MNNNLPRADKYKEEKKDGYIGKIWRYYQGKHKCIA